MATAVADPTPVGPRVRALREAMGLSLRDLAQRTGVSAPMLSQVERGETSPTLAVANRIATGLELTLSQLLRLDEADGVTVVKRSERRGGGAKRTGHTYEIVTPPLPGQRAEVSCHVLAPRASTGGPGDPPMHEAGSRETAIVTGGGVRLVVGEAQAVERLRARDLVDHVQVDVDQARGDLVGLPDLVEERLRHRCQLLLRPAETTLRKRASSGCGFSKWCGRSASNVTESPSLRS